MTKVKNYVLNASIASLKIKIVTGKRDSGCNLYAYNVNYLFFCKINVKGK